MNRQKKMLKALKTFKKTRNSFAVCELKNEDPHYVLRFVDEPNPNPSPSGPSLSLTMSLSHTL